MRVGWSWAVFADELPAHSAGFDAENRLYLFTLTLPRSDSEPGGRLSSCASGLLETPALPSRASEPGLGVGGISRCVFGIRQQPTSARPTRVGKGFPVSSGPSQPPQQAKMLREYVADGGGRHRAVRFAVCDIPALSKVLDELSRKLDCTLVSPR